MTDQLSARYGLLPGTEKIPSPPWGHFEEMRLKRGSAYQPRTKHLNPDGSARYTNRLFLESSPYLLQHAHNPVNWFPWGEEPFSLAAELGRPVLVSIGYATCHWCHVMEEESFEDEEIARFLNEHFVAIKVDREERPDLDSIYMSALHAMSGQGGWPLNVWLTPDKRPFYGGTYFPAKGGGRGTTFLELLHLLHTAYLRDPQRVVWTCDELTLAVQRMLAPAESGELPQVEVLERAMQAYRDRLDTMNGGVIGAPKFPSSLPIRLLLRQHLRSGDPDLLRAGYLTLRGMAAGGIYDQVAGGFHRYATDAHWRIPHFEKMLYDNALLAITYLEGYQLLGDKELARITAETLRYLKRDLGAPCGAFFSASDADSLTPDGTREEGYFFTWTPREIFECLGKKRGQVVVSYYGVSDTGNFEGRNILHRTREIAEVASELKLAAEEVAAILEESKEILYRERARRPQPLVDQKILTAWNGLAVSAFARAGLVLGDPESTAQAAATASFVLEQMCREGRLAHSHQEGRAKGEGFLDDYAFFIAGLIDLFEATGRAEWLQRALELTTVVRSEFEDGDLGGYFATGSRHERLIAREKPSYDGAIPSGNSVMIMNLLRLHLLTETPGYRQQAQLAFSAFSSTLAANPTALPEMLLALDFHLDQAKQLFIVAPQGRPQAAEPLLNRVRGEFLPNRAFAMVSEGVQLEEAARLVPALKGKKAEGARAVAYLCQNRTCLLPTSDPEELVGALRKGGH